MNPAARTAPASAQRLDPADLIDTGGIAALLGLTRAHVTDKLSKRPGFPPPVLRLSRKTVRWSRRAIERWIADMTIRAGSDRWGG